MESLRGLVHRPRASHGAQNRFDSPDQSWVYRTSSSSSCPTYGPSLGNTTLYTMDDWMFSRNTRENPIDDSVHNLDAGAVLCQDMRDTQEGYCFAHSGDFRDLGPFYSQIWSPPGANGFTQATHALAAYYPQTPYFPHPAFSTSMARLSHVAGQPPLLIRPNEPTGGDFTAGTSSTSSQEYSSPQSRSGTDPMHG